MADCPEQVSRGGSSEDHSFEATASLWRRLGEFALGLGWALFIPLVLLPSSGITELKWFMFPVACLSSLHFFRRALDPSPRLVVDSDGIIDRTSIFGKELRIPWKHVHSVTVSKLDGHVYLQLKDLRALQQRASIGRRFELFLRRLFGRDTIRIGPTMLGISKRDLGKRIEDAHFHFEKTQLLSAPTSRAEINPARKPQAGPHSSNPV